MPTIIIIIIISIIIIIIIIFISPLFLVILRVKLQKPTK